MIATNFNPRTPRGVRLHGLSDFCMSVKISIHAPREGCDAMRSWLIVAAETISIHAPREGCDTNLAATIGGRNNFNPRTPRGVRQQRFDTLGHVPRISIHAPREGCDGAVPAASAGAWAISIHAPREGCDVGNKLMHRGRNKFQSTHPARGATANFTKEQGVCLAQFAYLHKGKKAEHTKTNAPMLH